MTMTMIRRLFICYARDDFDFVVSLAERIRESKIDVWIDCWSIPAGANWDDAIDAALTDCDGFLIVLSPSAIVSREVRSELRTALDRSRTIVPVLYRPCEIPRHLKLIEYVDLTRAGFDDVKSMDVLLSRLLGKVSTTHVSNRQRFVDVVSKSPDDARLFGDDLGKREVLSLTKRLSNVEFDALRVLRISLDRDALGAETFPVSTMANLLSVDCSVPKSEARGLLQSLEHFGFWSMRYKLKTSGNSTTVDLEHPYYDCADIFWLFTEMMANSGVDGLDAVRGQFDPEWFIKPW